MSWEISEIAENQAADLAALFGSSGPYVAERRQSDYWLYARLFQRFCLCIVEGDDIAGVVLAFQDQTPGVFELYIQDLVVSSEYRRRGVATALMDGLHERAEQSGLNHVWLTSEPENHQAMSLWRRHGYVNHETEAQESGLWITRDLKGPGKDRVVFSREGRVAA